jgi:hypothetical protein
MTYVRRCHDVYVATPARMRSSLVMTGEGMPRRTPAMFMLARMGTSLGTTLKGTNSHVENKKE